MKWNVKCWITVSTLASKHAPRSPAVVEVSTSFIPVHFSITVYDSISLVSDSRQPELSRQAPNGNRDISLGMLL